MIFIYFKIDRKSAVISLGVSTGIYLLSYIIVTIYFIYKKRNSNIKDSNKNTSSEGLILNEDSSEIGL